MNDMDNCTVGRGYLTVPLYERSFGTEITGDFTLPDYQNEIRRILHVACTVLPPAKYVGDGAVEFNGTLDYQVIYIGGDGGMYSVPLSSDYSFSVPLDKGANADMISDIDVLCSVSTESVNTRVSAPRRLSIRCRIRPNVRIYGRIPSVTGVLSEVDPTSVYRRSEQCMSLEGESATSDIISVSYTFAPSSDDLRVVCADATVRVSDRECTASGMSCRGTVAFRLLCTHEESGEFETLEAQTPFEGEVDMETGDVDALCHVRGVLSEMSVNVGEAGIECSAGIILNAQICRNLPVEYTADVYSTANECDCVVRRMSVRNMLMCVSSNFTLSERIPLSSTSVPEGAQIIGGLSNVCIDKCSSAAGKYSFAGNAVFTVLYSNDGDIYSTDVNVPVKFETEGTGAEPAAFDAVAEADGIKLRIADGNLCIDAEMMICADCLGECVIESVDKITFGDSIEARECELIVCYPSPDDTLWSVAKRYKVAPTAVSGDPANDKYVIME